MKVLLPFLVFLATATSASASCFIQTSPYKTNNQGLIVQLRIYYCNSSLSGVYDRNNRRYRCDQNLNNCVPM